MPLIILKQLCKVHELTRFNDEFHSCDNCGVVVLSKSVMT